MSELKPPGDGPSTTHPAQIEQWLKEAREGNEESLGLLLAAVHRYLLVIANQTISDAIRTKVSPSDIVQETALEAFRDFSSFDGCMFDELLAWLRQVLLNNVRNAGRHFQGTQKRQVSRETPLDEARREGTPIAGPWPTASKNMMRLEQEQKVEQALHKLPPDMRMAIELRNREHLPFAEIGKQLGRSPDAARKLWARAIERLQKELGEP